jgi:hypothetical protein
LNRLIEFLQIVEQQVGPRPINGLNLADNTLFKIKPALPPAKNFGYCSLAFQRAVNRVPDHPVVQVDFTVSAAGLEGEPSTSLAHAAHLQNLGGGKLVQIADKRVTRVNAFGRRAGLSLKSG